MLSRAATSLTLLGRHLERADHLARILGVHVALSLDRSDEPGPEFWVRFMELAGWRGSDTGRREQAVGFVVARAANVPGVVTHKAAGRPDTPEDALEWTAVLKACFAFESFQARYAGGVTADRVIECLMLDRALPRSARFAASTALESVARIEG